MNASRPLVVGVTASLATFAMIVVLTAISPTLPGWDRPWGAMLPKWAVEALVLGLLAALLALGTWPARPVRWLVGAALGYVATKVIVSTSGSHFISDASDYVQVVLRFLMAFAVGRLVADRMAPREART